MNVSRSILALALAAAASAVHPAMAEDAKAPTAASFVEKAALDGMTEVALGKVALKKSSNESIQQFAQRMITDHGKANAELATLAAAKGMEAPKTLDTRHQGMVDSLEAQDGAAFDRAYAEHMNIDHSKAIELFEGASRLDDAQLAEFARKTLPTLKEHKKMAEKLPAQASR
jgi:putative membrane protein